MALYGLSLFNIDDDKGIIVYCTLGTGELRKYDATVITYISKNFAIRTANPTLREKIDRLQIDGDFVVTWSETTKSVICNI